MIIWYLQILFVSGLCQQQQPEELDNLAGQHRLPFRQLAPSLNDKTENSRLHSRSSSSSSDIQQHLKGRTGNGNRMQGAGPKPLDEPELLTSSQDIEVVLGDTTVLPCKVSNLGDGIVLWKQGERVISAGSIQVRKDYRLTLVEANSLRITDVDVTDTGNYTCEVEWGGSPISITHKLTVLVPPSIEAVLPGGLGQVDHPIEAREGSQVRLECRAEGIPPPIVRWRSPDGASYGSTRIARGPIMEIDNVRKEDSGTYICTASNNVGTISADQIELKVLYPPEVSSAKRAVYAGPGDRDVLTCIVKAEPRANVSWYKDGRAVHYDKTHLADQHGSLFMLRLKEITINDLGNYTCEAENSQGLARDHIELSGKPEMATINSSPEGLYRNSYNLTWSIKSSSPLEKVRILFRKMDQFTSNFNNNGTWSNIMVGMPHVWGVDPYNSQKWSDVRTNVRGGYSVHSHLFQHLEPDTRYEVIVQSKNHFGWSEPTKPFIFTTRYKDYSPLNMASHPSFRGALSSATLLLPSSTSLSIFSLILIFISTS